MQSFSEYKKGMLESLERNPNIDPLVPPLLYRINSFDSYVTFCSCQGHKKDSMAMVEFVSSYGQRRNEADLRAVLRVKGLYVARMNVVKVGDSLYDTRLSVAFFSMPGVIAEEGVKVLTEAFEQWVSL